MRARLAAVLAALAATPLVTVSPASSAQAVTAALTLETVPAWVAAGTEASLGIGVDPAVDGLELRVTVHGAVGSRTAYERTLAGTSLGGSLGTSTVPVSDLPETSVGREVTIDLAPPPPPDAEPPDGTGGDPGDPDDGSPEDDSDEPPPTLAVPITATGVHPVSLQLRDADRDVVVDGLVTHLVVFDPEPVRSRLAVAWVWPMEVRRPLQPDGTVASAVEDAVSAEGRMAQFVDALAAAPDVAVTLAPRPATVDAWARLAPPEPTEGTATTSPPEPTPEQSAAARLAVLADEVAPETRQLLAGTYATTDLVALAAAGLEREIAAQLVVGADVLRSTLGLRPDPRTFLASSLDDDALSALRDGGVDRLVVDPSVLVPVFENLTPARPFEIRSRGRTFLAAAGDPGLARLAEPPDDADDVPGDESEALLAQRLLAGLAVVALEAPGEQRGVVVLPEATWSPQSSTLTRVLEGLEANPALEPVSIDTYFERVPPSGGANAVRRLVDEQPPRLDVTPGAVRVARREIAALTGMVDDGSAATTAERLLLLAESAGFRGGGADDAAASYVDGARAQVRAALGHLRLPGRHTVTLTARQARIPITFQNSGPEALRVQIRLRSDKLSFPEGTVHEVVLQPRNTTVQLLVEARTSGTFPLIVEVSSPDGVLGVGAVRVTVRSTAVSGAALAVTVAAGVFLAGWWGNHIRKARRARRSSGEARS